MLGWFKAIMPKEDRFFPLFERHATIVVAGAEALCGVLKGGDEVERYCKVISDRETEADAVTREVLTAVRRTFITPFDRTDIQDLVSSMDDAIDQMNKTAKTIMLFEVRSFEPQMQQMGEIILQASKLMLGGDAAARSRWARTPAGCRRSPRRSSGSRSRPTSCTTRAARRSILASRKGRATRWTTSSAPSSTIIWSRWSTGSRTSRTRSTRSSSISSDGVVAMDAVLSLPVLIALIIVALAFDFLNGLHDAANSIATIVSTRVLRPRYAVMWAAFFNFIAFLFFGLHVAQTVGTGIVAADVVDARVIFGALMGAIAWNLITWWGGIPS